MSGYREEPDVFGDPPKDTGMVWWKKALLTIGCIIVYMIPLIMLWTKSDYPDSLGVRITAMGKAGMIEHWWYSYLLVERHHPVDLVTFVYMWMPVAAYAGWIASVWLKSRRNGGVAQ